MKVRCTREGKPEELLVVFVYDRRTHYKWRATAWKELGGGLREAQADGIGQTTEEALDDLMQYLAD